MTIQRRATLREKRERRFDFGGLKKTPPNQNSTGRNHGNQGDRSPAAPPELHNVARVSAGTKMNEIHFPSGEKRGMNTKYDSRRRQPVTSTRWRGARP
jgi:hypothetical protein